MRRVRPEDWEAHRALRLQMLKDAPAAFWTTYEQAAALDEAAWRRRLSQTFHMHALLAGLPVGSVGMWDGEGVRPERRNLIAMYVAPPARGRRIGEQLIQAVLDEAGTRGKQRVVLEVTSGNAPAIRLYRRMGFTFSGSTRPHPRESDLVEREMEWVAPGPLERQTAVADVGGIRET